MLVLILLSFGAGLFLGLKKQLGFMKKIKIIPILTLLLLFSMGTEIGANDKLFNDLPKIGIQAFLVAVFAVAGSFTFTYIYTRLTGSDGENDA